MDNVIDFTGAQSRIRSMGGSDRKMRVLHEGKHYILKFTEEHVKKTDVSTSHENNAFSEYISSHISNCIGIETHETIMGIVNDEICVGCVDFRSPDEENIEFIDVARSVFGPSELKRKIARLDQIYATINSSSFPKELREVEIERFWDTFIVDALVGNFDRHLGNWGLLVNNNTSEYRLAPVYDYGSTLFPILSDEGAERFLNDKFEMCQRCFVFPSPCLYLSSEKVGKPGFYDMLASNYDENCSKALCRIYPQIDMDAIHGIIDETPFLTDIKREFYKKILDMRYNLVLGMAFDRCVSHNYDINSIERLKNNESVTKENLKNLDLYNTDEADTFFNRENVTTSLKLNKTKDTEQKKSIYRGLQGPEL